MVKRPLTKEEIDINKKQIENIAKRNKWLEYECKYYNLMIEEGLEQNYLKTLREYKTMKEDFEQELNTNNNIAKELGIQIAEGVEIKNITEVQEEVSEEPMNYVG